MADKTARVISACAADFVCRCFGAVAQHDEKGHADTVV